MGEAGYLCLGLLAGGAAGWLVMLFRARAAQATVQAQMQTRIEVGLSQVDELRGQVRDRNAETEKLRAAIEAEQKARVAAETRVAEAGKNLEAQKKLLRDDEEKLKNTFKALSAEALKANTEQFTKQAGEQVKPLKEALDRYDKHVRQVEKDYGGVNKLLETIGRANEKLEKQTSNLVTALRDPGVKGRWGEISLRRAVEVAGLSPHCDFVEQPTVDTDEGRIRPDMVVRLPGNRTIVIDAKTPTRAYLDAVEADTEEIRKASLVRHARAVRDHMKGLAGKEYWRQFENTPDFVMLYIPGESFFSAALEQDHSLLEDAFEQRVVLASPTTLIAVLRAVAYSWQQQQMTENAKCIAEAGKELFDRVSTFAGHLEGIGKHFRQATEAYNRAAGSWQARVLPAGRKMTELGATPADQELPVLAHVDTSLRPLPAAEPAAATEELRVEN